MADFNIDNHRGKGRRNSKRSNRNSPRSRFLDRKNSDEGPSNGHNFKSRPSNKRTPDRNSSRKDFRPRRTEDKTPHTVICDGCGDSCEVPFKPSSDKPVYCDDCFKNKKETISSDRSPVSSRDLDQINEKLNKILSLLQEN